MAKLSRGKTFAVFANVHSTEKVFRESMAVLIGDISIQGCYTLKVLPQITIFLTSRKSFVPQKFCCIAVCDRKIQQNPQKFEPLKN